MVKAVTQEAKLPKKIIVTEDGKTYEKSGFGKKLGAVLVANTAGGLALKAVQTASREPARLALLNLGAAQPDVFKKAAEEAFTKSGLASKGVKIIDTAAESQKAVQEALYKEIPVWAQKIKPLKKVFEKLLNSSARAFSSGKNACFALKSNFIILNKDKASITAFHEMGHAFNKNMSVIGKVLQKIRKPFTLLASVAIFTALFKRKKVEGEKPKGFFDKTTTFIKKHCGALALLGLAPTLAEEALASINAHKIAKGVLSPENLKTLNKFNGKCWLTYAGLAAGMSLAAVVASKIKDAMTEPKEVKI
jgi:hypothetical protein